MRRSSRSGTDWSLRGTVGKVDFDLLTKVERENSNYSYVQNTSTVSASAASSNVYSYGAGKPAANGAAAVNPVYNPVVKEQCYFCNGFGHKKSKCHKYLAMQQNTVGKGGKATPQAAVIPQLLAIGNGAAGKADKGASKGNLKGKGKKGAKA
jgi:hypothetical protein